jgi:uncharacterized protein (DUF305 family)
MRRILLALVAAFLLAACNQGGGNQEQGTAPPEAAPSDADVSFTQNMIPHHQQAIEMAQLVDTHTDRPELRQLADSIVSSQSQEITQMEGWLRGWGKPATPSEGHGGHGDTEMPGMMIEADMGRLMQSTGTEFDLAFVEMMAAHHQGAIDMATTELRDVALPEVNSSPRRSSTPSRPNSTGSSSGSSSGRRRRSGDRELGRDATLGVLLHTPDHPPGRAFLW